MTTIAALFAERGGSFYDETVTQTEHALQTAALAEAEGAPPSLVVAALLHDVGHLLADEHTGRDGFLDADAEHERLGADLLRRWFGDEVTEPVALHVPAKRYLVATDPAYAAELSPASVRSLAVQGGPMTPAEADAFIARPHAVAATRLRRWDDRAKVPGLRTPPWEHYASTLASVAQNNQVFDF